jgi:kynureninase
MTITPAEARALDRDDPLTDARRHFDLPEGLIYLDGNSLGPPPAQAKAAIRACVETEWATDLIASWNSADWMGLPLRTGARIARLIGVPETSVIAADSVSVNIFKLAAGLLNAGLKGVAVERGDFPTDGYVLEGLSRLSGTPFAYVEPGAGAAGLPDGVQILVKSAVHFRSAAIADIAAEERAAKARGAAIVWDLSHAAGLVDLRLAARGARYAVGCGYKFLNGGPGAPAFVYCDPDLADGFSQPLSGWMGHARPFDFADGYEPAPGVARFGAGTPAIVSMTALHGALEAYEGVDMAQAEAKARALGDLFLRAVDDLGFGLACPGPGEARAGHVSLTHEDGYAIVQAMIARGVVGDFRSPDILRFGFSPLYLSYADVLRAARILREIMDGQSWREPRFAARKAVT